MSLVKFALGDEPLGDPSLPRRGRAHGLATRRRSRVMAFAPPLGEGEFKQIVNVGHGRPVLALNNRTQMPGSTDGDAATIGPGPPLPRTCRRRVLRGCVPVSSSSGVPGSRACQGNVVVLSVVGGNGVLPVPSNRHLPRLRGPLDRGVSDVASNSFTNLVRRSSGVDAVLDLLSLLDDAVVRLRRWRCVTHLFTSSIAFAPGRGSERGPAYVRSSSTMRYRPAAGKG